MPLENLQFYRMKEGDGVEKGWCYHSWSTGGVRRNASVSEVIA